MARRISSRRSLLVTTWLLLLRLADGRSRNIFSSFGRTTSSQKTPMYPFPLTQIRGGAEVASETKAYRLKQQLYLQSRSLALREALIARGLSVFSHQPDETVAKPIDWDCALATAQSPKSCLFSFDAEENSKVVAPLDTDKWISLRALNRLRRTDPTKIEPLWHNQFPILTTWMSPSHRYTIYSYLSPPGAFLSWILDTPGILSLCVMTAALVGLLATLPVWEGLVRLIVTSEALWLNWPNWGRFVHANLPLKLLMGQMTFKFLGGNLQRLVGYVRDYLVEVECNYLEACTPLTITEESHDNDVIMEEEEGEEVGGVADDEIDEDEDYSDDYDDEDW